ncbi:Ig domain-containing protein [Clostridium intestinale]|uniref:Ig domain-containing protein n=1 Tax=Clostridium intestinale TaxID=36845 RepID=UPI000418B08D|nr:Ig domain-containing protein [Clostridium intestinale]
MKIQSKKKFIAFSLVLILATIFSLAWIQGARVSAATVGEQLLEAEEGWKRYDDTEAKITYIGNYRRVVDSYYYKSSYTTVDVNGEVNFKFSGTKLRIIGLIYANTLTTKAEVYIDDVLIGNINEIGQRTYKAIVFEKLDLSDSIHTCKIVNKENLLLIDAIDIDESGYLTNEETVKSNEISLNKISLNLNVGQTEDLIATVKPDNVINKMLHGHQVMKV